MSDNSNAGIAPDDTQSPFRLGIPDIRAIEELSIGCTLFRQAAALNSDDVMLALLWPGRSPSVFADWAAGTVSRISDSGARFLRVVLLGTGRRVAAPLDGLGISSDTLDSLVRARLDDISRKTGRVGVDLIQTALSMPRDDHGSPEKIPLSALIPYAVAIRGTKEIWRNPQERFHGRWFGLIRKKIPRDYFGSAIESYCNPARAPFFAFILPQASVGRRRVEELAAIPGRVDLAVLDLSDRQFGAAYCIERLETLLRDLKLARAISTSIAVPLLVLTGQPADFIAIRQTIHAMTEHTQPGFESRSDESYLIGKLELRHMAWPRSPVAPLTGRVKMTLVGTSVDEISARLWDLADQVNSANEQLRLALRDASATLRLMARRATCPRVLEQKSDPIAANRLNWMARRGEILSALDSGGAGGYEADVKLTAEHATTVARALFDQSPTGAAFSKIASEASSDQRILFVVDNTEDALYAQAHLEALLTDPSRKGSIPEVRVVSARQWSDVSIEFSPSRLVVALRGPAIAQMLLVRDDLPETIDVICLPAERDRFAFALEQTIAWPEYRSWHGRARALLDRLPPTPHRLLALSIRAEIRESYSPPRRSPAAHGFFGWYEVETGERISFFSGTAVTVLVEGEPKIKPARDLEHGDLVFVMPDDLKVEIAAEFEASSSRTGLSSSAQAVVAYKEAVRKAKSTPGVDLRPASVIDQMRRLDPSLPVPIEATIRTWLSAGDHMGEGKPYAAGGEANLAKRRFVAFAQVIGLPKGLAEFLIQDIEDRRTELRAGGFVQRNRFERLLFDPEDVVVHFGIRRDRVDSLRRRALEEFREVVEVQVESESEIDEPALRGGSPLPIPKNSPDSGAQAKHGKRDLSRITEIG